MLKKKLVTIVAAAFCVALVTAQQSVVYRTTGGLIEDGAIDSLKFGTEDGSGVVFGQYLNDESITLGWGNSLSDTLWLSVYDAWKYKASTEGTKATAINNAQADDGINVDYSTTTRKQSGKNSTHIANDLGVGVGINNTLGFQLVWGADYLMYKNPVTAIGATTGWGFEAITSDNGTERDIKSEVNNPGTGENTKKEWTKYSNNNIDNNFVVNFKGVGVEDIGDIAFFVKLNKVYFNWNSINRTGDYTESSSTNGKTTSETTITGKNTENTLTPGLDFDLGLNIIDNDVSTVKFVYADDFSMAFKPRTNESTKVVKNPIASATTETTTTNSYKVNYGKYLKWSNKFEPKLVAEFNVAEPLQLKAQLSLPVTLTQEIDDADTYEKVTEVETFNRQYGYSYRATGNNKETITGEIDAQNTDKFTTKFSPSLVAGFVYEVTPGKFNVNFGAGVTPNYTWTTTTKVNANINTVTVTETKDEAGNSNTSKTVAVANNGNTETKETTVTTSIGAGAALGATWFFTENVSFDVYFQSQFGANIFQTAGASVTVKF